jgi:hypothetical protein
MRLESQWWSQRHCRGGGGASGHDIFLWRIKKENNLVSISWIYTF